MPHLDRFLAHNCSNRHISSCFTTTPLSNHSAHCSNSVIVNYAVCHSYLILSSWNYVFVYYECFWLWILFLPYMCLSPISFPLFYAGARPAPFSQSNFVFCYRMFPFRLCLHLSGKLGRLVSSILGSRHLDFWSCLRIPGLYCSIVRKTQHLFSRIYRWASVFGFEHPVEDLPAFEFPLALRRQKSDVIINCERSYFESLCYLATSRSYPWILNFAYFTFSIGFHKKSVDLFVVCGLIKFICWILHRSSHLLLP